MKLRERQSESPRCGVCRDGPEGLVSCYECKTLIHASCMIDMGSCPTLGCNARDPLQEKKVDPSVLERFARTNRDIDHLGELMFRNSNWVTGYHPGGGGETPGSDMDKLERAEHRRKAKWTGRSGESTERLEQQLRDLQDDSKRRERRYAQALEYLMTAAIFILIYVIFMR